MDLREVINEEDKKTFYEYRKREKVLSLGSMKSFK